MLPSNRRLSPKLFEGDAPTPPSQRTMIRPIRIRCGTWFSCPHLGLDFAGERLPLLRLALPEFLFCLPDEEVNRVPLDDSRCADVVSAS